MPIAPRCASWIVALLCVFLGALQAPVFADSGLGNADQMERDRAAKGAVKVTIGQRAKVGSLTALVRSIEFSDAINDDGTDNVARIAVDLRVENRSKRRAEPLDVNVACINTDESGGWYADSTFGLNKAFPAKSYREGTLYLGVPAECAKPRVRISQTGLTVGRPPTADVAVPATVLAQIAAQ